VNNASGRVEVLKKRHRWLLLSGLGVISFLVWALVGMAIGGMASLKDSNANHYFLTQHGRRTEVSRGVWIYSLVHSASQLITFPLAIVAGFKARDDDDDETWSIRGRGAA
jgi:hypothetical protein